jgi:hypothetical protein
MKIIIFFLHSLFIFILCAENISHGYSWEKTFGGFQTDSGRIAHQTVDGGYIIIGLSNEYSNYLRGEVADLYFIKTDANGNMIWEKYLYIPPRVSGFDVQRTSDGGYIGVAKKSDNEYFAVYIIKLDADLIKVWENYIVTSNLIEALSIQQTIDGGYIITGTEKKINEEEDGVLDIYVYFLKTDSAGNKLWERSIKAIAGNITWERSGSRFSTQQTPDEGYAITGETTTTESDKYDEVLLIKTDTNGNKLWEKTFGFIGDEEGQSILNTSDGGFIIVGSTTAFGVELRMYLIKTDANGNKLWEKTYGNDHIGRIIQKTKDGGYIIVGDKQNRFSDDHRDRMLNIYDVYLLKIDANGNKLWEKTFGGEDLDQAFSVQQTIRGGYILTGRTFSFGATFNRSDVYLIYYYPENSGIDNGLKPKNAMPWIPLLLLDK